ncbi:MAG: DNA polymerase III subunit delta [Alphaproteobacteria bacterium]|nr:DNA polymerase III subunit delta [Alphaproteobacteria bacterium]
MKLRAGEIEGFVKKPPASLRAALVFGSESNLVHERAERLARAVVPDLGDAFRVALLTGAEIAKNPSRLIDEAAALSMLGGRRVVRVRDAGEAIAKPLEALLDAANAEALVVIEAGDLGAKSALVKLFEAAPHAACLPCYPETGAALEEAISTLMKEMGLAAGHAIAAELAAHLPADRGIIRSEIAKLSLYLGAREGEARPVTEADIRAIVVGSLEAETDDIADAVADGDMARLAALLARSAESGTTGIGLLRMVSGHLLRLHAITAAGRDLDAAASTMKIFVPWSRKAAISSQMQRWTLQKLEDALAQLLEAERLSKQTGTPEEAITSRALMSAAALAARRGA